MSKRVDPAPTPVYVRDVERTIERLLPTDAAGDDRRIHEQLHFATHLAAYHEDQEWAELVEEAVAELEESIDGTPAAELADRIEEILKPMGEAARSYTVHYVGHAHIDMNWLWDYPETVDTTYRAFETMIDLMDEFPSFRFSQSQASTYAMMKEHAPELYERIKERIDAGTWEVTANTWVEADKNMPTEESHARHLLYTNDFLREEFDLEYNDVRVDFEPDTFGHPRTIPKLLVEADIDYYYLGRSGGEPPAELAPGAYQGVYENFPELFWWESPDGSRVLVFNTGDLWYNGHVDPANVTNVLDFEAESGLRDYLITYGVGNHGGGPTRKDVRTILEMDEWPVFPETRPATLHEFFETVEAGAEDLPTVTDELNFFFRGCYSSQNLVKRANRRAESRLVAAEAAAVIAEQETDVAYPAERLGAAWRTTLFHQFHDILPGAGINETYDHALGEHQKVETTSSMVLDRSLEAVATGFDFYHEDAPANAYEDGVPLLVFNPTGDQQTNRVETVVFDYPAEWDFDDVVIEGADGNAHPVQVTLTREDVQGGGLAGVLPEPSRLTHDAVFGPDFVKLAFTAHNVPAFGYEIYWLHEDPTATTDGVSVIDDEDGVVLENDRYRVEVDASAGAVRSLYDTELDCEFVPEDEHFGLLSIETEAPHGMSAWIRGQVNETEPLDSGWCAEMIENGPGEGAIRCTRSYGDTNLSVTIRLAAGGATVDWTVDADWREFGSDEAGVPVLKAGFPTVVDEPTFTYDVPFGSEEREATGLDVPAVRWADVSGSDGAGVVISNDTTYGHAGDGNELSLTLLRGSYYPDPIPEVGDRRFRFSVRTHGGDFSDADATRHGIGFHRSLEATQLIGSINDDAEREKEYVVVESEQVAVLSVKAAEREDSVVVRLEETEGAACETTLRTAWPVDSATETDVLERPIAEREKVATDEVEIDLDPHEVETLLLTFE